MNTVNELQTIVTGILREYPATRKSDKALILSVFDKLNINVNAPFYILMMDKKRPNMQTITRCRRRAQRRFPELKDETVAEFRDEDEVSWRAYMEAKR